MVAHLCNSCTHMQVSEGPVSVQLRPLWLPTSVTPARTGFWSCECAAQTLVVAHLCNSCTHMQVSEGPVSVQLRPLWLPTSVTPARTGFSRSYECAALILVVAHLCNSDSVYRFCSRCSYTLAVARVHVVSCNH